MTAVSEIVGFAAAALVLATFAMRDMRLLRITAILSNFAFILYAGMNWLLPVLMLHLLLLPINYYRLTEFARGSREMAGRRIYGPPN